MAHLRFLEAYDIRDLPAGDPSYRSRGMTFSDDASTLRLGIDDATAFRPKVSAAATLDWGEITRGETTAALLTEVNLPGLALRAETGLGLARALLSGADRVTGSAGEDRLFGFAGDDTLAGGLGADAMTGGGGADTFRFTALAHSRPGASDLVTDFQPGRDTVDLRGIDAVRGLDGDQAFDFIADAGFTRVAGELRVAGHVLQADVDGDGLADFAIRFGSKAGVPDADDLLL